VEDTHNCKITYNNNRNETRKVDPTNVATIVNNLLSKLTSLFCLETLEDYPESNKKHKFKTSQLNSVTYDEIQNKFKITIMNYRQSFVNCGTFGFRISPKIQLFN